MSGLFGLFGTRNSLEDKSKPLTDESLVEWLGGTPSDAGVTVSEEKSLTMSAVYRAVNVVSSVAASLPLHTYRSGTRDRVRSKVLERPHPDLTPYELWRLSYVHRLMWGNSYMRKIRNSGGEVTELRPLQPASMRVEFIRTRESPRGEKRFWYTDYFGEVSQMQEHEVLHIPALGYDGICGVSPIRAAAEGVGLSLAAKKAGAKFFGQGAMLSGVLQTEQRLDPEQARALKDRWKSKVSGSDNAYDIAVLDSGAEFKPVTMPFRDAQFLESRRFEIAEIARMFGVPLFLMMETERSTSWGTGLEQQATGFVTFDLAPTWLKPTESRISKELLSRGQYAEHSVEGLLRSDSASRSQFYRVMREVGAYSANDIRDMENLPAIDGGDTYLQPSNMDPLGAEPDATAAPAAGPDSEGDDDDEPDDSDQ